MMDAWGMRSGPWGRQDAPPRLTIMASPLYGVALLGPFNADLKPEPVKRLVHQANMTAKHIATSGCRGPRPKA